MYIANCPFNKIKILSKATTGLEKSFWMMYSNLCLNSPETVALKSSIRRLFYSGFFFFKPLLLHGIGVPTYLCIGNSPSHWCTRFIIVFWSQRRYICWLPPPTYTLMISFPYLLGTRLALPFFGSPSYCQAFFYRTYLQNSWCPGRRGVVLKCQYLREILQKIKTALGYL